MRGVRNGGHADHQPAIGCFVVLFDFEAGTARSWWPRTEFHTGTLKSRLEYAGLGLDDASKATPQRVETVPGSGVDEKEQREIVAEEGMEGDGDDWID